MVFTQKKPVVVVGVQGVNVVVGIGEFGVRDAARVTRGVEVLTIEVLEFVGAAWMCCWAE